MEKKEGRKEGKKKGLEWQKGGGRRRRRRRSCRRPAAAPAGRQGMDGNRMAKGRNRSSALTDRTYLYFLADTDASEALHSRQNGVVRAG